jgi:hypothetical protein
MNEDSILSSLTGKSLKDIAAIIYKQSQDIERYKERESSRGFVGTFMGCPVHADLSTVDKGARAYRLGEITKMFREPTVIQSSVVDPKPDTEPDTELQKLIKKVEGMHSNSPLKLLLHIARKLS